MPFSKMKLIHLFSSFFPSYICTCKTMKLQYKPCCGHQDIMSVLCRPPYNRLLYSKIGVYRGILYFLFIFALKYMGHTAIKCPFRQRVMFPKYNRFYLTGLFKVLCETKHFTICTLSMSLPRKMAPKWQVVFLHVYIAQKNLHLIEAA